MLLFMCVQIECGPSLLVLCQGVIKEEFSSLEVFQVANDLREKSGNATWKCLWWWDGPVHRSEREAGRGTHHFLACI